MVALLRRMLAISVAVSASCGSMAFVTSPTPINSRVMRTELAASKKSMESVLASTVLGFFLATSVLAPQAAFADGQTKEFRLPPINFADKSRCTLQSSSIGQANAARDKLYDLRMCDLSGAQASGFDLSGVIMTKTDLSKAKFEESYFSKAYMRDSNFEGADFTNAIVDRATFKGSSLRGAIFKNAVLTATSFEGADVEGADFTEAAFGEYDIRGLCKNPTLKGENPTTGADTRETVGCIN